MSDDSVVIRSLCGSAELRLSEPEGLCRAPGFAYFRATLQKTDIAGTYMKVVASTKIHAYGPHGELSRFFDGMAADRDGWEGEKRWESVGEVLTLRGKLCTTTESACGAVAEVWVEVELKSGLEDWWLKAAFILKFSQLEEVAAQVAGFFSAMAAT